jgi:NitT/TauT family transport system permease protein
MSADGANAGRGRLLLYRTLFGVLLVAFWQWASGRLIDPFWISSPSRVFAYLAEITRDGSIFAHAAVTLYETVVGFVIGALIGIGAGFLLAGRETLAAVLDPYIVAFNGIPRIALAPLFIIWFGIGPNSKVVLVVLVVFFLTFFSTYSGIKGVDVELKNLLRIMGASERQVMFKITVPATIPWILTGLKLSVPYALVGAVVGEFVASDRGLGYLINYNTSLFSTTGALGGILVLAVVVVISNEALNRAEARLLRWRPREEGRSRELL